MSTGGYVARSCVGADDLAAVQRLRSQVFRGDAAVGDADRFDPLCEHVMVVARETGALACAFRLLWIADGTAIGRSYSAQVYDLSALRDCAAPMLELGRFCLAPGAHDPDILRLAWGFLTRRVDAEGAAMLFGCTSFAGTDPSAHLAAFAQLRTAHLAPPGRAPGRKAPEVFDFDLTRDTSPSARGVPPLLRTYLAMGGWVSDHAVIDRDLATMHVFTGLEIASIPPARARLLRADAARPAP